MDENRRVDGEKKERKKKVIVQSLLKITAINPPRSIPSPVGNDIALP
jgi:hypothetical protein